MLFSPQEVGEEDPTPVYDPSPDIPTHSRYDPSHDIPTHYGYDPSHDIPTHSRYDPSSTSDWY